MYPNLKNGDYKIATKIFPYNKKDLIIFEKNGVSMVKMLVGKYGDHILIKDNNIFVNGENWNHLFYGNFETDIDLVVHKDNLFVLGTNLNFSDDSRVFGFVVVDEVKGKILF